MCVCGIKQFIEPEDLKGQIDDGLTTPGMMMGEGGC